MVQQQISTNTFGCAKWVVSADATQGTHTTIAAAITSASSGDTIFIRPGTYTEDLTLKAGVNLIAFGNSGSTNIKIIGKATLTAAGAVTISGIYLQTNGDFLLAVTGNSASIVLLNNCYLNCVNFTGISFTSSSASSQITVRNCDGDLGTTLISLYSMSAAGVLSFRSCAFGNSGSSVTPSSNSAGSVYLTDSTFYLPFASTSGRVYFFNTIVATSPTNTCGFTSATTGDSQFLFSQIASGTATAITIGANTTVQLQCVELNSINAVAITGTGTLIYSNIFSFPGFTSAFDAGLTVSCGWSRPSGSLFVDEAQTAITGNLSATAGTVNLGADATSGAINIGTGAAARTTTLGNTTGASVLALKYGTGDFTLASATGTIMTALDTGEITQPLQPAFLAFNSATDDDVTGDGTQYTIICDTEVFDQNADYNTGTGIFTAPVTGKYKFLGAVTLANLADANDMQCNYITSNRTYSGLSIGGSARRAANTITLNACVFADMDAADTCYITSLCGGATKIVDVQGNATACITFFSGNLEC